MDETESALPVADKSHPYPAPFQNCTYYWGFAAWMAYYINHPLYTPPSKWPQTVLPSPTAPTHRVLPSWASPRCFLCSLRSSAGETGARHLCGKEAGCGDGVGEIWAILG